MAEPEGKESIGDHRPGKDLLGRCVSITDSTGLAKYPGRGLDWLEMGERDGGGRCPEPRKQTVTLRQETMERVVVLVAALIIARMIGRVEGRPQLGRMERQYPHRIIPGKVRAARWVFREGLD